MEEWQRRRITVTKDRVGLEVVSGNIGNQREWVELDLNGSVTGRWKLDGVGHQRVVLTSDNQVYRDNGQGKSRQLFRLNRATSTWEPMSAPTDSILYGSDGDNLVFAQWPDSVMHMSWFPQAQVSTASK
jgi:hypothetical protein